MECTCERRLNPDNWDPGCPIDGHREMAHPERMVGKRVRKKSGKPFKSHLAANTVSGVAPHPQTGRLGYTFREDDSVVECWRCEGI